MQTPFEATKFRENFKILDERLCFFPRDNFTKFNISFIADHDNPFNLLIKCLKDEDPQIRGSAKAYMAYRMMKDTDFNKEHLFKILRDFFDSEDTSMSGDASPNLGQLVRYCDPLDEQDFTLLCQAISEYPMTALQSLFQLSDLDPAGKQRLPQLFSHLHYLTSLSLPHENFYQYENKDRETFHKTLSSLPNLSELDFSRNHMVGFDAQMWKLLGDTFTSLPTLTKLSLTHIFWGSDILSESTWVALCQALSKAAHLVSLDVSGNNLTLFKSDTLNSWETFCNALSQLPRLESVTLHSCKLQKLQAIDWQHLGKLTPLCMLNLGKNFLGKDPAAWMTLCHALGSLPHLTSLDLSQNCLRAVSHEGWQAFTPVFASLKHLSLQDMDATDLDTPASRALKNCKPLFQGIQKSSLISLNLSKNVRFLMDLDEPSFELFCQAIVDAKNLSTLILSWGPFHEISEARFEKFWQAIIAATHLSTLEVFNGGFEPEQAPLLMPIFIEGVMKAKHLTTIDLSRNLPPSTESYQFFWNTFNHSLTHITSLGLSIEELDEVTLAAFTQGLSEARHLRSFDLEFGPGSTGIKNEDELLFCSLESLFNLIKFETDPPQTLENRTRIAKLLKRNNCLSQAKTNVETLTSLLNSPDHNLNANEIKQAVEKVATAFSDLLETLPNTPNATAYQEEAQLVLGKLYFTSALWLAKNNEPQLAIDAYTEVSPLSNLFQKARENAFTIAFQTYVGDGDTLLHAFPKALPLCLHANRLIQLDGAFQRVFDGFLLEAVGVTKTLHLLSHITPQIRIKLFKYMSLLMLKEELQTIKSTDQTKFFSKPQIHLGLVDMLAGLKLLDSLEQLDAVGVDALWTGATRKYASAAATVSSSVTAVSSGATAVIPSAARDLMNMAERIDEPPLSARDDNFEFFNLLCQVISQLDAHAEVSETIQKGLI